MRKSILHGFWRGVIAVGLGSLLAPAVIHLLVEPISAGDGFFGRSWHWFWDQFFAFLPVLAVPVAIYALVTLYLGPGGPHARRSFLREWKFVVASLGRVRLAVVVGSLGLMLFMALAIPQSFARPLLTWSNEWSPSTGAPRWQCSVERGSITVHGCSPAEGLPRQIRGPYHWVFADYECMVAVTGLPSNRPKRVTILNIPLCVPLVAFAFYPTIVIISFFRGPLRRRRRQERGLCVACGYNLAGLIEHRCPECGQTFDVRQQLTPA